MQWIPASQRKPKVPERSLWLGLLLLLSSPAMAEFTRDGRPTLRENPALE